MGLAEIKWFRRKRRSFLYLDDTQTNVYVYYMKSHVLFVVKISGEQLRLFLMSPQTFYWCTQGPAWLDAPPMVLTGSEPLAQVTHHNLWVDLCYFYIHCVTLLITPNNHFIIFFGVLQYTLTQNLTETW